MRHRHLWGQGDDTAGSRHTAPHTSPTAAPQEANRASHATHGPASKRHQNPQQQQHHHQTLTSFSGPLQPPTESATPPSSPPPQLPTSTLNPPPPSSKSSWPHLEGLRHQKSTKAPPVHPFYCFFSASSKKRDAATTRPASLRPSQGPNAAATPPRILELKQTRRSKAPSL